MPRLDRDNVPLDRAAEQREVADDIEDFVAHELVLETERLLPEHLLAADDDRVLKTPPLDEPLVHERL